MYTLRLSPPFASVRSVTRTASECAHPNRKFSFPTKSERFSVLRLEPGLLKKSFQSRSMPRSRGATPRKPIHSPGIVTVNTVARMLTATRSDIPRNWPTTIEIVRNSASTNKLPNKNRSSTFVEANTAIAISGAEKSEEVRRSVARGSAMLCRLLPRLFLPPNRHAVCTQEPFRFSDGVLPEMKNAGGQDCVSFSLRQYV